MNLTWFTHPKPGNFGDIINPYLFKKYGYDVKLVTWNSMPKAKETAISIGSIAKIAIKGTRVLGSGVARINEVICPEASWEWVRGPITREIVLAQGGACPELYGDPALLMPRVYQPNVKKEHSVGFIPHVVDYEDVKKENPNNFVINLLNADITKVIDDMCKCESVVSSSLHGVIVAHAYGIPATWIQYSDRISGDGTKFIDYFNSVGIYDNYHSETLPTINTDAIHEKMRNL